MTLTQRVAAFAILLLSPLLSAAQTTRLVKVPVSGYGTCNVVIHYPASVSATNPLPAVVFVPGAGEVGTDYNKLYAAQGPLNWYRSNGNKFPEDHIVIGAQSIYKTPGAPFLKAILTELKKPEYMIKSFAGTGLSSGCYAWIKYIQDDYSIPLTGAVLMGYTFDRPDKTGNFANLPTWIICGREDGGHYSGMKIMFDKLAALKYPVKATWHNGDHCCWNDYYNPAYKEDGKNIYEFMLGRTTPTTPPVVISKRILITQGSDKGRYMNKGLNPGDTAVLAPGDWSYFTLENLAGITVIPGGDVRMTKGIAMISCKDMEVNGQYRLVIRGVGADTAGPAISVTGTASNITVREIIAKRKTYGFWWKNEASCNTSINYPANVMRGNYIYDNRIDSMTNQGGYWGSTDANNHSRPITCNGTVYNYLPSRIENIEIIGNYITNCGRPGIQVSGAFAGNNIIRGNTVRNTGIGLDPGQNPGITVGAYTRATIEDNDVDSTAGYGIYSPGGAGQVIIRNNRINNSGYSSRGGFPWASAIAMQTVRTVPVDSTFLTITGNKIGRYRHPQAIDLGNVAGTLSTSSTVCGNTGPDGKEATVNKTVAVVIKPCGVVVPPVVTPPKRYATKIITLYNDGTFTEELLPVGTLPDTRIIFLSNH